MTPDQIREANKLLATRDQIECVRGALSVLVEKIALLRPAYPSDILDVLEYLPERTETTEALYEVLKTAHFLWELETDTKLRALGVDTKVEST